MWRKVFCFSSYGIQFLAIFWCHGWRPTMQLWLAQIAFNGIISEGITIPSITTPELRKRTSHPKLGHSQLLNGFRYPPLSLETAWKIKSSDLFGWKWKAYFPFQKLTGHRSFFILFCVDKVLPDAGILSCWAWKDLWRREDNHLFLNNGSIINKEWMTCCNCLNQWVVWYYINKFFSQILSDKMA